MFPQQNITGFSTDTNQFNVPKNPISPETTLLFQNSRVSLQTTLPIQGSQTLVLEKEPTEISLLHSYDSIGTLQSRNALISDKEVTDYIRRGEVVGEGTFGKVYQSSISTHEKNCKYQRVAIKVLKQQNLSKEEMNQFMMEMSILSQLEHPNIVAFYKACIDVPFMSILTEYISNGTLTMYLDKCPISLLNGLSIMKQIAEGMRYLHEHIPVILHLDLKSDNILVGENGSIKISDFGLSFFVSDNEVGHKTSRLIRGTPGYCSPESIDVSLFNRLPVDKKKKSDVFSFGIVFWEVIHVVYCKHYNRPYYEFPNLLQQPFALMNQVSSDKIILRPKIPVQCDSDVATLISMCFAHHYDSRPDFNDILEILNDYTKILQVNETPLIKQSMESMTPMNKLNFVKNQNETSELRHLKLMESEFLHEGKVYVLREFRCCFILYYGDSTIVSKRTGSIKISSESNFQLTLRFKFKNDNNIIRIEVPWMCFKNLGCVNENNEWIGILQLITYPKWSINGISTERHDIFDQFSVNFYTLENLQQFISSLKKISLKTKNPGKHMLMVLSKSKDISFTRVKPTDCRRRLFQDD
ncbi:tyrosin kinase, putative [Entamoeba histolytica HM-1:IMSS-B]|uniref:Protein kinase, putative n=6 Tax=Entamoeba histolytica TaxID=5759 RepID=C4M118_ENTH1|nr:protein kinase, putative [Entamoeba histolytica HM-1:IMSS]EMD43842.1 ephrin typeA receptor 4A, putative [Entamoeba histolytica KU27]EMH77024.1 tyrosin kinase, putative [Entamoeba histolytica HM-1:IMSS-B]EMS16145.1 ephrin type-a receptor 4a, putative [Entamoeba histolytica HM-3:IMSS]ENY63572.1 ephrin type-a receptor 4a, putative [Entamoeba histolytica HM-1:IMSS-A]GAT94890.1 tyrosin kinase putative [Entamoeba histolytica]|eukprot:XP_653921.1 protein kinase, putative [Entamoeba histolytica HM-1:IMSS]